MRLQPHFSGCRSPGDITAPGDFDGDGTADISVFRPSYGHWYCLNSSTGAFTVFQFDTSPEKLK